MKKMLFLLFVSASLLSCRALVARHYHMNRPFNFTSAAEYFDYLKNERHYSVDMMLVPDSASYNAFFTNFSLNVNGLLYGCYFNDSIRLRTSATLQENPSCMGRILSEIKEAEGIQLQFTDSLTVRDDFNRFQFRELATGRKFAFSPGSSKLTIFLIHSYEAGSFYDQTVEDILKFIDEHPNEIELKVITLDPVSFI